MKTSVWNDKMTGILLLCFLLPLVTAGSGSYGNSIKSLPHLLNPRTVVKQSFFPNDLNIGQLFTELLDEDKFSAGENISAICLQHLNITIRVAIEKQKTWAIQFLDAAGKIPSGLFLGNIFWMGEFDECLNLTATVMTGPNSTKATHPFKGQYCKIGVPLGPSDEPSAIAGEADIPVGDLQLGLCVPNTCPSTDVLNLFNSVLGQIPLGNTTVQANAVVCYDEKRKLDTRAIVSITILSILGLLVVIGTIYDVFVIHQLHASSEYQHLDISGPLEGEGHCGVTMTGLLERVDIFSLSGRILQAFSLYTNSSKLLSTKSGAGTLGAVNGIRFLSMSWVILGHCYVSLAVTTKNVYPFLQEHVNRLSFMTVLNASVAVDTFFLLSGLLVAYLSLKELNKVGGVKKFKWGMFYFHRFWRLTPAYGLVMLLYIPLLRYMSNGPFWPQNGTEKDFCEKNFWMNILYINNLFDTKDTCMLWSWYLANDMQFYIISPLLLIPLYLSKVFGGLVCFGFLITSFTVTGLISTQYRFPMSILGVGGIAENTDKYFDYVYIKPYCRIGPYIVGMIFGYILYKTDCKKRISRCHNLFGWLIAAVCCLSTLYGNFDTIRGKHIPSKEESALHNALNSSVWGLGVGWVVYACATGYGGIINSFLSWKLFIPLSRLTYISYLIHPVIMEIYFSSKRDPIYITDLDVVYYFLGHLVLTNAAAFILSLVFESPFMGLEKAIFRRQRNH